LSANVWNAARIASAVASWLIAGAAYALVYVHLAPQPVPLGATDPAPPPGSDYPDLAHALAVLVAIVLVPIVEEFLFRGYLYGALKRGIGMVGAIGVTSLLFALIHGHVPSLAVFFVLAVCLGIAFEKSGSLIVPMAMHSLFNAVSVCVMLSLSAESL